MRFGPSVEISLDTAAVSGYSNSTAIAYLSRISSKHPDAGVDAPGHVDDGHAVHAAGGADGHPRMEPVHRPLQQLLGSRVLESFGGFVNPGGLLVDDGKGWFMDGFAFGHH